jgi:phosphohistidine phosphatase
MRLLLMRHGKASALGAQADADRPLAPEGEEQAARAARALVRLGVSPELVLASPLLRCRRMAEIVAERLGLAAGRVRFAAGLAPGAAPRAMLDAVRSSDPCDVVLLVGHQPDLENLASFLLVGRNQARLRLPPGGCGCLEAAAPAPPATLDWWLTPEQLRWIAGAEED